MSKPLSSYWEALLKFERKHRSLPPIETTQRSLEVPLTSAQQRLWFLYKMDPNSSAYNMIIIYRLRGKLNKSRMIQSLYQLIERHQILSTVFYEKDGQAFQKIINRPPEVKEKHFDSYKEEGDAKAKEWIQAQCNSPFNLSSGPLFETILAKVHHDEHILMFRFHHIIVDAISINIFLSEFQALYNSDAAGTIPVLPDLPVQFYDYVAWEQKYNTSSRDSEGMQYWRGKLKTADTHLNMRSQAFNDSKVVKPNCSYLSELPVPIHRSMLEFTKKIPDYTLYNMFLAAFRILLYRYTSQENLIIGSTMASRNRPEVRNLIGFFANTLPLNTLIHPEDNFFQVLSKERDTINEAIVYQDISFEQLVREFNIKRDSTENPLFQTMLTYVQSNQQQMNLSELTVEPVSLQKESSAFDLTIGISDTGNKVVVFYEYDVHKWSEELIEQFNCHYQILLQKLLLEPEKPIHSHMFLTECEFNKVIFQWNDTSVDFDMINSNRSIVKLIEQYTLNNPGKKAVYFDKQSMTYKDLDQRSNQLASILTTLGVSRNHIVGISMERSFDLVVSLLAVLKAGGAFMPLDSQLPSSRLLHMIRDSECTLILTQSNFLDIFRELHHQVITVESLNMIPENDVEVISSISAEAEDIAYVIYTSGSTGKPKGAMNSYKGLTNRLMWMQKEFQLVADDKVLQKTPFTFDVAVWEFFWPLMYGAGLVLAKPEGQLDPNYIGELIIENQVTTVHFVPAMLQVFLDVFSVERCNSLKRTICSGEELSVSLQDHFLSRSDAALFNLYGPTEAAIDVTFWECRSGIQQSTVPIGRPISNTQIYILDQYRQPVPIGVYGEIYIGGKGVGLGYVGNQDLTEQCFVSNPFLGQGKEVLYRTGDVGTFSENGTIIYRGRNDHQIKLHGIRIELGEIEVALRKHSQIRDIIVHSPNKGEDHQFIVAYYVGDEVIPTKELRDYSRAYLPSYMIPSFFIKMDKFPLSRNGKVDRKELPQPDSALTGHNNFVASRNDTEKTLSKIWKEILQIEDRELGIYEDFFDLGGHSLLALKLVSAVNNKFNNSIKITDLFLGDFSIARMAKMLVNPTSTERGYLAKEVLSDLGMSFEEVLNISEGVFDLN